MVNMLFENDCQHGGQVVATKEIFSPRGIPVFVPVPPESMDQILGAPPTFTAFLLGLTAGCRPAQQEIRPRSVTS